MKRTLTFSLLLSLLVVVLASSFTGNSYRDLVTRNIYTHYYSAPKLDHVNGGAGCNRFVDGPARYKPIATTLIASDAKRALTNGFTQTEWVTFKLDKHITVKFPSTTNIIYDHVYGYEVGTLAGVDILKLSNYNVRVTDYSMLYARYPNSDKLISDKLNAMLSPGPSDIESGVNLTSSQKGTWNGFTCLRVKGVWGGSVKGIAYQDDVYALIVFMGTKVYRIMASIPHDGNPKDKDYFFNSIELNKDAGKYNSPNGKWTGIIGNRTDDDDLMKRMHFVFQVDNDKFKVTYAKVLGGGKNANAPIVAEEKIKGDSLSFALATPAWPSNPKYYHGRYYRLGDSISLTILEKFRSNVLMVNQHRYVDTVMERKTRATLWREW